MPDLVNYYFDFGPCDPSVLGDLHVSFETVLFVPSASNCSSTSCVRKAQIPDVYVSFDMMKIGAIFSIPIITWTILCMFKTLYFLVQWKRGR